MPGRQLFLKAVVRTANFWGDWQAAIGQKQWDGLLLNLKASQCARLNFVFVKAKYFSHGKRRSP